MDDLPRTKTTALALPSGGPGGLKVQQESSRSWCSLALTKKANMTQRRFGMKKASGWHRSNVSSVSRSVSNVLLTNHIASRQPSPPSADVDAAPWPILAFQLLSSSTQILAAISSLIDIASGTASPTPFGTQHIALLLAAWAPCMIFGGSFLVKRLIR